MSESIDYHCYVVWSKSFDIFKFKVIKTGEDHNGPYIVYKQPWNEFETRHYNTCDNFREMYHSDIDYINSEHDKFFFVFEDAKDYAIKKLKDKLNNLNVKLKMTKNLTEQSIYVLY